MPGEARDCWAEWMLKRRFGDNPAARREMVKRLQSVRDLVLDHACVADGETLLDVGAGDGLIAFSALDRVGENGRVIFSDISQDLLDHSRALAEEMGAATRRITFVRASADDLAAIGDDSIDVVTTRSVLIFVKEKRKAFAEFYRVLRTGGRISLFEPINRYGYPSPLDRFWGYDVGPVQDISEKVREVYRRAQPDDGNSMLDFDERDLVEMAENAGFKEVHLRFEVNIEPPGAWSLEGMLQSAPNPLVPNVKEAMEQALMPEEIERFVNHLRPLVEGREGTTKGAVAYLWALK